MAYFYFTDKNTEAGAESWTPAFESYLPPRTGFAEEIVSAECIGWRAPGSQYWR